MNCSRVKFLLFQQIYCCPNAIFFLISGSARVPALESRGAPVPWDGGRPPDWRDQGGGEPTPNGVGFEEGQRFSQSPPKEQPKKAPRIVIFSYNTEKNISSIFIQRINGYEQAPFLS